MADDPLFNNDPPFNEPFDDLLFMRNESPLQGETSVCHPLINGAYMLIIPVHPC
jgi:hypothetical protein